MYAHLVTPPLRARRAAARDLRAILHGELFRALCEPMRLELIVYLTAHGRSDIATIAAAFPLDRSVISRHLALLQGAGLLRRAKEGRRVFFELDGPAIVARLAAILERFRAIVPHCCPAPAPLAPGARRAPGRHR
jgi:DNA-binding transcriptional ArsR family regulator